MIISKTTQAMLIVIFVPFAVADNLLKFFYHLFGLTQLEPAYLIAAIAMGKLVISAVSCLSEAKSLKKPKNHV